VRTPSAILTDGLKAEAIKHKTMLENAARSDAVIKSKIDNNAPAIEQLGGTQQDLESAIPSSSAKSTPATQNPHVETLKARMQDVTVWKKEAETFIEDLKNFAQKDDIVPLLLEMYGTSPSNDGSEAFSTQLANYNPFSQTCQDLIKKQENLLATIMETHQKFISSKSTNDAISKREVALKQLDVGYNGYKEIRGNLKDGMKFYSTMEAIVNRLKEQTEDFCLARQTELKDLVETLQRQTSASAPPPSMMNSQYGIYSLPQGYYGQGQVPAQNQPGSGQRFNQLGGAQQPHNPYYPFPQNSYY
jgi:programmed cell death 6-interacting protein